MLLKVYVIQTKSTINGLIMSQLSQGDQQFQEANGQQVRKIHDKVLYESTICELKALAGRYPGIEAPTSKKNK